MTALLEVNFFFPNKEKLCSTTECVTPELTCRWGCSHPEQGEERMWPFGAKVGADCLLWLFLHEKKNEFAFQTRQLWLDTVIRSNSYLELWRVIDWQPEREIWSKLAICSEDKRDLSSVSPKEAKLRLLSLHRKSNNHSDIRTDLIGTKDTALLVNN